MYLFLGDAMAIIAELLRQEQSAHVRVLLSLQRPDVEGAPCLDLFLYWVGEVATLRLAPRTEPGPELSLHFLLIPGGAGSGTKDLRVLGRGMQVLHDHAVIEGELLESLKPEEETERVGSGADGIRHIRITPYALSSHDIQRVWDSARQPYTLSVAYEAVVMPYESDDKQAAVPLN